MDNQTEGIQYFLEGKIGLIWSFLLRVRANFAFQVNCARQSNTMNGQWLLWPPLHSCLLHLYMKGTCFFFSHFLLNYWVVSYQTNQVPPMPGFFVGFNIKHTHHKRWPSLWVLCCHQCKGLFGMYCVLPNTKNWGIFDQ